MTYDYNDYYDAHVMSYDARGVLHQIQVRLEICPSIAEPHTGSSRAYSLLCVAVLSSD